MCVDKAMAQRIAVKVLGCYQISVLIFTGNGVDLIRTQAVSLYNSSFVI